MSSVIWHAKKGGHIKYLVAPKSDYKNLKQKNTTVKQNVNSESKFFTIKENKFQDHFLTL